VLLWLLGRVSFAKLITVRTARLAYASLLEGRVAPGAGPVNSSSWLLVGASWASRWEDIAILRVLIIVVPWWLVLLVWVSWTLAAPLVFAVLADLDLGREQGLAVMASTANAHANWTADQVLTAGAGWDGEFILVTVLLLAALVAAAGAVLVLWLLGWEARASLASAVMALGASLLGTEGGSATMAVAMNSHTNLLVNAFTLWWLRGKAPVGWVDLKSMLSKQCLSTLSRRQDWWLWWSILWGGGLGLLDFLSLDGNWRSGGFFLLANNLGDGRDGSSVLSLLVDAQDLAEEAASTTESLVGAGAGGDRRNGVLCWC